MSHSQEDFQRLEKLFKLLCDMIGFGKDIKYKRDYQEDRGLRSILDFIGKGGKAEQITVNEEQADLFRKRLQDKHVTYYETVITRDDNTQQHLFMYKGTSMQKGKEVPTPDKLQVEKIKKMFEIELSCKSKEMDVHSFKDLMNGSEVGVADNLTLEQVYSFRQNVRDTDIKFCVLQDKDDTYKIYASDAQKLTSVLVRTSYDLANDTDGIFKQSAQLYAQKKHDFYEQIGKEPFIICDRNNPNNFIYVDKRNYSIHSFQKEEELQPDGTTKDIIRDKAKPQLLALDKEKLFEHTSQFANPIKMSVAEFTLLGSMNKKGVAFANPHIADIYPAFKQLHQADELVIEKYPRKKPRYQEQMLDGYMHLPMSLVQQMQQDLPFIHTNDVDSIAFEKENKPVVDAYLQEHVFDGIKDPMQALSFKWKIEGRSGLFNPQLSGDVTSEFYILNPDNDKLSLSLDQKGIHVYRDGKESEMCPADAPNYNEFLKQYIHPDVLENPVVLTLEEMQSENSTKLINERANRFHDNPAIEYMVNLEENEKRELVENIEHLHEINLSPEQEKAVQNVEKLHVHSKELDSAVFVEMQDLAVNKEVSKDTEIDL